MDCHFRDLPDFQSSEARLIREFSIVRERRHVTPCLSSAPSSTGYCEPVCGQREIGRFRVQDLYVDYSERMSHERNEEM